MTLLACLNYHFWSEIVLFVRNRFLNGIKSAEGNSISHYSMCPTCCWFISCKKLHVIYNFFTAYITPILVKLVRFAETCQNAWCTSTFFPQHLIINCQAQIEGKKRNKKQNKSSTTGLVFCLAKTLCVLYIWQIIHIITDIHSPFLHCKHKVQTTVRIDTPVSLLVVFIQAV